MRKYVLIVASIVLVAGAILYLLLGGTSELVFKLEERPEEVIYGQLFEGRPTEQRLEALFIDTRERSKEINQPLVVVNYEQDSVPLKQFIGTMGNPKRSANLEALKMPSGKYVSTKIESHSLVMPRPDEIREAAENFADLEGVKLNPKESYEIYKGDSALVVMFWCL